MYVSMYVCTYAYMYVCTYVRMYVCMYVCTYVCMNVCPQYVPVPFSQYCFMSDQFPVQHLYSCYIDDE